MMVSSDPLIDYSSLSLFPLSFNPNSSTIGSLHSHLKSMVSRSPEKLLKQAKTVLDDSLDLLKSDETCALASEDKTEAVVPTNEKDLQVKRPALGLKRAKFSAKYMPRQPDAVPEPSMDIDKFDDPEKFFAEYERMENAKKELQRLRGQPLNDLDQNLSSLPPRSRRPSLIGKSATYKHHSYSSAVLDDNNEVPLTSEETFVHHVLSPVRQDVPSEINVMALSPNSRVLDSSATETKKVSELDELLSCDYDGLDEAGVLSLLQEKLDIRLKDIDATSLPDFHDVRPRKSLYSDEALSKVKNSISHLNGIRKAVLGEALAVGSQPKDQTVLKSLAWTKSPLASISSLNRHISKLVPLQDPFSVIDVGSSPAKSLPETQYGKQSGLCDARIEVYESQSSHVPSEEITAVASPVLVLNDIASSSRAKHQLAEVCQFDQAGTTEHLHDAGNSPVQKESNAVCGRESPLSLVKRGFTDEPKERADNVSQYDQVGRMDDTCEILKSPHHFYERVANPCENFFDLAARDMVPIRENDDQEDQVVKDDESVRQKLNIEGSVMKKSTINEVEGCGVGEVSVVEDICSEEPTKETRGSKRKLEEKKSKGSSQASPAKKTMKTGGKTNTLSDTTVPTETGNKRRKVVADALESTNKNELRRQSLCAAGTKWEAGLRRSTRIKMRPLDYWKRERFLYGRVHNSLVTVIGVKYGSPSKEIEQPRVKVKSFVSNQHEDKLELAASF